jgi:glycosyltransferase involved in cell wall biosynthesis
MTGPPDRTSAAPAGPARPPTVLVWGTYDLGKPRTRILLRGLREAGVPVVECHAGVWNGVEDKSQLRGTGRRLRLLVRWLSRYPRLVLRYLRAPRHDVVLVGYPGLLDLLVLRPWAKLRRVPVVWDVFVPLYEAVVEDRELVSPRHPAARLLRRAEGGAARRADRVLLDTRAQAERFRSVHGLASDRVGTVPVGVEPEVFPPLGDGAPPPGRGAPSAPTALFYGQMIPLHGVGTILEAAASPAGRGIRWRMIGRGQEVEKVERALREGRSPTLDWVPWVPYDRLHEEIAEADVCLGIFGTTAKAARVIPNKVYQVLAVGKPLVTRDGPGIRELLREGPGIRLIPPGDARALVAAVTELAAERWPAAASRQVSLDSSNSSILPVAVGLRLRGELEMVLAPEGREAAR